MGGGEEKINALCILSLNMINDKVREEYSILCILPLNMINDKVRGIDSQPPFKYDK